MCAHQPSCIPSLPLSLLTPQDLAQWLESPVKEALTPRSSLLENRASLGAAVHDKGLTQTQTQTHTVS